MSSLELETEIENHTSLVASLVFVIFNYSGFNVSRSSKTLVMVCLGH